jgi:AmmeMemoRadiSam system protein A
VTAVQLSVADQRVLLDLARETIRAALTRAAPPAAPVGPAFAQPAGCFVTLHESGTHRLRGCVGRLEATTPLGHTVVAMAEAVLEDPRFTDDPVTTGELGGLDIELSILSPLTTAAGPLDFDLTSDGIYLTYEGRAGCFLPQVARETGWSKEQLLDRLCSEKMGLPRVAWRHQGARLFRFTTLEIGPEPFVTRA